MSEPGAVPFAVYEKARDDMHKYKAALGKLRGELEQARSAAESVEALRKKVSDLEGQLADATANPSQLQAENERLKSELRQRDHRAAWDTAAKAFVGEKGETIREDALEALWKLSGYTPDSDTPDAGRVKEAIRAAATANPWSLRAPSAEGGPAPGGANDGTRLAETPPPPGSGRSESGTTSGRVRYTRADIAAPDWMNTRPDLVRAINEGRAEMVEG